MESKGHGEPQGLIAFVVYDGLQVLDLSGPWEVFHAAAAMSGRDARPLPITSRGRASSALVAHWRPAGRHSTRSPSVPASPAPR